MIKSLILPQSQFIEASGNGALRYSESERMGLLNARGLDGKDGYYISCVGSLGEKAFGAMLGLDVKLTVNTFHAPDIIYRGHLLDVKTTYYYRPSYLFIAPYHVYEDRFYPYVQYVPNTKEFRAIGWIEGCQIDVCKYPLWNENNRVPCHRIPIYDLHKF